MQWVRGRNNTVFWIISWKISQQKKITTSLPSLGVFTSPWPKEPGEWEVIFTPNLSHKLKKLRGFTLHCKVNQCIYPSCRVQQQLFPWLRSMSTDRHPRLSCARLLKNLQHRAAKFKVKKCWAQSHRVIPRWVSRFRQSDPLVIKASGRIHSWKFVQINFRNWSSSVINRGAQAHSRGMSESELYLLTSSRTHHTTAVTTRSKHMWFLLH